jgi:hypothetical protein
MPAEQTLLERLVPRRSTLRSDRRPGNKATSPSRSRFLMECRGTERSFNAPPHLQDSVGVCMNCQVRARPLRLKNCFGVVGPKHTNCFGGVRPTRARLDYTAPDRHVGARTLSCSRFPASDDGSSLLDRAVRRDRVSTGARGCARPGMLERAASYAWQMNRSLYSTQSA